MMTRPMQQYAHFTPTPPPPKKEPWTTIYVNNPPTRTEPPHSDTKVFEPIPNVKPTVTVIAPTPMENVYSPEIQAMDSKNAIASNAAAYLAPAATGDGYSAPQIPTDAQSAAANNDYSAPQTSTDTGPEATDNGAGIAIAIAAALLLL